MGLNKSTGNMYEFVTHTWNTVKGECPHGCTYCYMKRWGKQNPVRFDKKEFGEFDRDTKKYGEGLFIFVGSSCDMFAEDIPDEWIVKTMKHCQKYDNKYLLQSKAPHRIAEFLFRCDLDAKSIVVCTTIETNRYYRDIITMSPVARVWGMETMRAYRRFITIEPIMKFDLEPMVKLIERCEPEQVNIGADSGGNNLPEPPYWKVLELIGELEKFTTVKRKKNLSRLQSAKNAHCKENL